MTISFRTHPETSLAITCAKFLRTFPPEAEDGSEVIWLRIANENESANARRKLTAMGLLPGAADLIFISRTGAIFVELKTPEGRLSKDQKIFRDRCFKASIPYEIAYSLEDLWHILWEHEIMNKRFNP